MCIILNTSYLIGGVRFREKGAMKKKNVLPTRGLGLDHYFLSKFYQK